MEGERKGQDEIIQRLGREGIQLSNAGSEDST